MSDWQPIETAPRDGTGILAVIGETIPDLLDVRVASFITGQEALDLGHDEFAETGGWMIWNDTADWFVLGLEEVTDWMPLPVLKRGAVVEHIANARLPSPLSPRARHSAELECQ